MTKILSGDKLNKETYGGLNELNRLSDDLKNTTDFVLNNLSIKNEKLDINIFKYFNGIFVPNSILKDIKSNNKTVRILLGVQDIELEFLISYKIKDMNETIFFKMALKALIFCKYIKDRLNKKYIKIKIYYSPNKTKKILKNKIIGPDNCNSGFTKFFFDKPEYICIFREEENSKVLIHELIHYFKLDFSTFDMTDINKKFIKNFDVKTNFKYINIFEAFTDFYAILINSILNSILFKLNLNSILKIEKKYQNKLTNLILSKNNMTNILKNRNKTKNRIIQKSNVLSYYFLKNSLTKNMFLTIYKFPIFTKWNYNKINSFCDYILEILHNEKDVNILDNKSPLSLKMTYFNL